MGTYASYPVWLTTASPPMQTGPGPYSILRALPESSTFAALRHFKDNHY